MCTCVAPKDLFCVWGERWNQFRRIASVDNGFLYIFSHINRRTQFENPVLEAKRKLQQRTMPNAELGIKPLPVQSFRVDNASSTLPRPKHVHPRLAPQRSRSVSDLSQYRRDIAGMYRLYGTSECCCLPGLHFYQK
ncbi:hypothetical protein E2320_005824 [Naja naja]|nr:hypothetical protein E2320_005824 [Naja naja]